MPNTDEAGRRTRIKNIPSNNGLTDDVIEAMERKLRLTQYPPNYTWACHEKTDTEFVCFNS